jgi:hypothetical protein
LFVTVEQFSDTRRVGFPEATPLSVTDNARTDNDTRRSVGVVRRTIKRHWQLCCTRISLKGVFAGKPAPTGISQFL